MWIVLVLAGLVLVLARTMRVEALASANELSRRQAEAIEHGAIQYVLASVDSLAGQLPDETEMPCQAVIVGAGGFWIIRPNFLDDRSAAYGLVDEGAKLNLNTAGLDMLSGLFQRRGMTDELAAGIVDWRDADSNLTQGGAESEYYMLLPDPYQCKNGPLETVSEFLLVRGAGREMLTGEDANRNGTLDANEDDGDVSEPPDNRDGKLDRGLGAFLTIYSAEPNTTADGQPRVNVNQPSQGQTLGRLLRDNLSPDRAGAVMGRLRRGRPFRNIMDFYTRSGLTLEEFGKVADLVTTTSDTVLRGLINVNTAPREVLACLPGLEESDVAALVSKRMDPNADTRTLAWVVQTLKPEKLPALAARITTRSFQYSADIVSVAGDGRAFRRCRVIVDARNSPASVVYRQDLTHLGWPLSEDILDSLRAGTPFEQLTPAGVAVAGDFSKKAANAD